MSEFPEGAAVPSSAEPDLTFARDMMEFGLWLITSPVWLMAMLIRSVRSKAQIRRR